MASTQSAKRAKLDIPVESPIGKLSNELLLEVFEFFDAEMLKEASLVCEKCEDPSIIGNFKANEQRYPFKVKSFRCGKIKNDQERDLANFLLAQSSSLEDVDVIFKSRECFEVLLTKMKRLRTYRIDLSALPTDDEFYLQLKPSEIKEIHGKKSFPNKTVAKQILGNCPHLEVLDIPRDKVVHEILLFLSNNNRKLTSLTTEKLGNNEVHFPALKNVTQTGVHSLRLHPFLRWNPTIENLTFDLLNGFDSDFDDNEKINVTFLNEFRFKRLTVKADPEVLLTFYISIKGNKGSIEKLELYDDGQEMEFPLEFTFPEDQSKWSRKQEIFNSNASSKVLRTFYRYWHFIQ